MNIEMFRMLDVVLDIWTMCNKTNYVVVLETVGDLDCSIQSFDL